MTIVTTDNESQRVQIGQPLNGVGIARIIIEAGDERHPEFLGWLTDNVLPRLAKV